MGLASTLHTNTNFQVPTLFFYYLLLCSFFTKDVCFFLLTSVCSYVCCQCRREERGCYEQALSLQLWVTSQISAQWVEVFFLTV